MVKVSVEIFTEEDKIVSETKEKFGFKSKNDALNFIIRKFENNLRQLDEEKEEELIDEVLEHEKEDLKGIEIFDASAKKKEKRGRKARKSKKLNDEKEKQSLKALKNILSES